MDILELKTELHLLIDQINDADILEALKIILSKQPQPSDNKIDVQDYLDEEKPAEKAEPLHEDVLSHDEVSRQIQLRKRFPLNDGYTEKQNKSFKDLF